MDITERHHATAAMFTALVENTTDWDAPTPVVEWTARDIVGHLTSWLPGLLQSGGIQLPSGPSAGDDPAGAWRHQAQAVQDLLGQPDVAGLTVMTPGGQKSVVEICEQFYEPDVFIHAWDLARATGQDVHLDEARCTEMYAGMSQMEPMLRATGQFGQRIEVGEGASAEDRLIGFVGRDPHWTPPR